MDLTPIRNGLLQLQHDAQSNDLDFDAVYQEAQHWGVTIRRGASFQPLKEGVAMTVKPLPLLTLENDVGELLEALQAHDLCRTRQSCAAALESIKHVH